MPIMKKRIFLGLLFISQTLFSQPVSIGSWNSYLSYINNKYLTRAQKMIFVGGQSGLFSYNTETGEINRINTIHGLSELNVAVVKYDPESKVLFVGYESTNIDILYQAGQTVNSIGDFVKLKVPDLFRYSVVGTKILHDVYFHQQHAYISTSFGIVDYDLEKREVKDSYTNINPDGSVPDVTSVTINNDKIYASTNLGIMEADLNSPNLKSNGAWQIITDTALHETSNNIIAFNNNVYAVIDSSFKIYAGTKQWIPYHGTGKHSIFGFDIFSNRLLTVRENGFLIEDVNGATDSVTENLPRMGVLMGDKIWFIKDNLGLIGKSVTSGNYSFVIPSGPITNEVFSLDYSNNKMWVMAGRYTAPLLPAGNNSRYYTIEDYTVNYYSGPNLPAFDTLHDCVVSATSKDGSHTYIGTFSHGLIEMINGELNTVYGKWSLPNFDYRTGASVDGVKITGLAYDRDDNLWVINFLSSDKPVYCRLPNGAWRRFRIKGLMGTRDVLGKVVIDDYGIKWIRTFESNGLLAFKETNLNDSLNVNARLLNDQKGQGALVSKDVQSLAIDKDGELWIGTANGVSVIGNPGRVFDADAPDARIPYVREGSVGTPLLQYETVSAIEVDGANRKWIGTHNGLWLFNSDGSKALKNFNVDNSPLFSNNIIDLEMNSKNGELFIATDKGLMVYKTDAVNGGDEFTDVYAYPNPVRPNYTGPIAIKGLISDCIVKITDVAGNLVYETVSNGGQATWDGNDFNGNRAASGIYIVFASSKDGAKHYQTKIAIVN